ncbi:hypothetical protein ILUMI_21936 [Ignelater luminosus]|uniref:Solute carrier family 46 member 3 n=1 Tax=Ignelater luminosus TaxID=2038154 RepID=A0A8K0CBI6_IGNLU|nr:hypothetical protein ILUMI_21936 [Ignelater luminosus]
MALQRAKSVEAELHITAPVENDEEQEDSRTFLQKAKIIVTNITVEPVFVMYLLPSIMASLATQNLNLEKACRVNLNLSQEICDGLASRNSSMYNETDEIVVQKLVASMYAWKNIVQSLVPAILLIFIGSWSDRHQRRKPCIVLPIFGEALTSIGFLLCTFFFYQLPMEFSVLSEALPPALTGGWFTMFMGVYSYVSGISSVETRTVRIGAISTISNISWTIGIALSGILYVAIGFYGVFSLSLTLYVIGIIYGCVMIKESKLSNTPVKKEKKVNFLKDFFDTKHIVETFRVAVKDGAKNRKKRICVIMLLVMVIIGPLHGEYQVMYLFVRYKFGWNEIDFSIFQTYNAVVYTLGTIFSLSFFSKYLKMDDALLGVISSTSKVLSALVYAFAPNPIIFYLGAIIEMLNGTSFIALRSIISKLVSPDELGKINSLFGVSEALMPLVYGPMYSLVYKWTINVVPGAFYLFGGVLTFPAILIFLWLYTEHKKDAREEKENKAQEEELLKKNEIVITTENNHQAV